VAGIVGFWADLDLRPMPIQTAAQPDNDRTCLVDYCGRTISRRSGTEPVSRRSPRWIVHADHLRPETLCFGNKAHARNGPHELIDHLANLNSCQEKNTSERICSRNIILSNMSLASSISTNPLWVEVLAPAELISKAHRYDSVGGRHRRIHHSLCIRLSGLSGSTKDYSVRNPVAVDGRA
jgi:hypothetical protein